jgi:hypothetical protein
MMSLLATPTVRSASCFPTFNLSVMLLLPLFPLLLAALTVLSYLEWQVGVPY